MLTCRKAEAGDVPRLEEIWLGCFEEKTEAVKLFFERNKGELHSYAAEENGTIIAAVHLIDCMLDGSKAHYLCGAATLPRFRGRGVMSALIAFALDDAKKRGDCFSVLLPANEGLYRFYAGLGYTEGCCVRTLTLDCGDSDAEAFGKPDTAALQKACLYESFLLWSRDHIQFARDYYGCYGTKVLESSEVFALYEQDGDFAEVIYAVFTRLDALKALLHRKGVRRFTLPGGGGNPLFEQAKSQKYGMIRPLDGAEAPQGVYIGLTLS